MKSSLLKLEERLADRQFTRVAVSALGE